MSLGFFNFAADIIRTSGSILDAILENDATCARFRSTCVRAFSLIDHASVTQKYPAKLSDLASNRTRLSTPSLAKLAAVVQRKVGDARLEQLANLDVAIADFFDEAHGLATGCTCPRPVPFDSLARAALRPLFLAYQIDRDVDVAEIGRVGDVAPERAQRGNADKQFGARIDRLGALDQVGHQPIRLGARNALEQKRVDEPRGVRPVFVE